VVGNAILKAETTEPAVGQIQMDLLAQAPLRADAKGVADDQHPDHQLRVDRGPAGVTVERRQVPAQIAQVQKAINATQQVIPRHMVFQIECVEQRRLAGALISHHGPLHPSSWSWPESKRSAGVFQHNRPNAVVPGKPWILVTGARVPPKALRTSGVSPWR
jgi:hypothetical protein